MTVEINIDKYVLELLDNPKIKEKISGIIKEVMPVSESSQFATANSPHRDCSSEKNSKENICSESIVSVNNLGSQISQLQSEIGELKEELCNSLDECYREIKGICNSSLEQTKKYIEEFINTNDEFVKRYNSLNDECKNLQKKHNELKSENEGLQSEVSSYLTKLQDKEKELGDLQRNYENLETQCNEKESEIVNIGEKEKNTANELEKSKREVNSFEERFSKLIEHFKEYKSLSNDVRTGLSDIVCCNNEVLFIASCSAPERLMAIWDYIKRAIIDGTRTERDICSLSKVFDYAFNIYNSSLNHPMYTRDNVKEGDYFDEDRHIRYPGSKTSGKISQVVLKGYISNNTGKIIRCSLVRL